MTNVFGAADVAEDGLRLRSVAAIQPSGEAAVAVTAAVEDVAFETEARESSERKLRSQGGVGGEKAVLG